MAKKLSLAFITLLILSAILFSAASAQGYSFNLEKEDVIVDLRQDGTVGIDYTFDFSNNPGASPIEYVDLGLPNSSYDLASVTADVNGQPVTDITKADPQNLTGGSSGITVALGNLSIPPGQKGRVHIFIGTIRGMFYPSENTNVKDYASVNFSPAYWISSIVTGNTDLTVTFHLPPGIKPEEPLYYTPQGGWPGPDQPESALDDQDRVYYRWHSTEASAAKQYTFGAGFPARVIPASSIVRQPARPAFQFPTEILCCLGIGGIFALIFGLGIYNATAGAKKRKLAYLPPKISIEGHGIKRGLTAIEAAILMEQPLDKVLTMILFSVVKKGAATVITKEPLEIQVSPTLPSDLQPYEQDFLAAFRDKKGLERRKGMQDMTVNLVKSVSEKMKGFSRKETIAYYESIINTAWQQVEAAGTPEVKSQKYEEVMDWTMLDRNYGDRTRNVFGPGPVFVPIWWGRYDPVFRSQGGSAPVSTSTGGSRPGGGSFSMPSLPGSDFAASVVNGAQTFAAGVLGDVAAFTGGITTKTNPPPPPPTTSRGSGWHGTGGGGGGHCVCACACACAGCACACAGGGR